MSLSFRFKILKTSAVNVHVFNAMKFRAEAYDRAVSGLIEDVYAKRLAIVRPTRHAVDEVGELYVAHALPRARELIAGQASRHASAAAGSAERS